MREALLPLVLYLLMRYFFALGQEIIIIMYLCYHRVVKLR